MTAKMSVNLWRSRPECVRAEEQVVSRVDDSVWLTADGGRCAQHYE